MRTLVKIGFSLLALAVVLIIILFGALRAHGSNSGRANPEGRVVASESRTISDSVNEIDLSGPINMTLRQGATPSLTVRGEQRLLGNIETSENGHKLSIGTKGMLLHHRQPLQVVLTLPAISSITVRGSGDSTINGFSGDKVDVQLYGSGNVKFNGRYKDVAASVHGSGDMEMNGGSSDKVEVALVGSGQMTVVGQCKEFKAEQTGTGDLDAEHLAADRAEISLRGSGTSVVQARKTADVTLRGSGDVSVLGNPDARTINRTGSGDVTFRDQ
ncbi:head GIN domain-containing protein [Massilia sp. CF038]|uniref:head GIN domain-containing protein n=1 Tax=Massilia sp. CF038 TaxID=1881045 RepID=UPI00091EA4A0|nr:head GIN domain-containing protein [Massilia sp. CF038]SHG94792.1 Putative auto-transporter adhesin, head GIN domain [Massilia sp. CF038]